MCPLFRGKCSGGIYVVAGTFTFSNSIVANHSFGQNCVVNGQIVSTGYNLESANTCLFASAGDLINTNPLLGALASNGGPTQTMALGIGSPAIDAGSCVQATDQRGYTRVAPCDIGAFEYGAVLATPVISVSPTSHSFGNVNVGLTSTAQTFTITNNGTANLVISTITLTGTDAAEFNKSSDTCSGQTVAPAGTCTVQATLTPATAAAKSANISIPSNDPNTPTLTIALSGTGIQQYTLTVTKAGTGTGTVTGGANCTLNWVGNTGTCTVNDGTGITLSGSANIGSIFITGWSGGTGSASSCTGMGNCIFNITQNSGVTATFTLNQYAVTTTATNGTITSTVNPTVNHGSTTTVTGSANAGYYFTGVSGCGGVAQNNTNQSITTFSYTTGAITSNCTVAAIFAIKTYTVTAASNPAAGGSVICNPNTVNHGSTTNCTATVNDGYSLLGFTGCGGAQAGNTYTTGSITGNCTVTALFALDPRPDLTVDWTREYARGRGGMTYVSAFLTVTNIGTAASPGATVTFFEVAPGPIESALYSFPFGGLAIGESKTNYFKFLVTTGNTVRAKADAALVVPELNEGNNSDDITTP